MSKIGLSARLAAILEAAERIDPFAARVHRLPPALRLRYDNWQAEREAIHAQAEREGGPGASYAAMIEGALVMPQPSRQVAAALGLNDAPVLSDTMSAADVAAIWAGMVDG